MKHTEGPWRIEAIGPRTIDIKAGHNALICRVDNQHPYGTPNANLISIVPELLAALEDCVKVADSDLKRALACSHSHDNVFSKARAVIAKAREVI